MQCLGGPRIAGLESNIAPHQLYPQGVADGERQLTMKKLGGPTG